MAEVHTLKSRVISANGIPYSRLNLQAILDRTRETLRACPSSLNSPSSTSSFLYLSLDMIS